MLLDMARAAVPPILSSSHAFLIHARMPSSLLMMAERTEAERLEKLKQLFGTDYKDEAQKELARVTEVAQPAQPEELPGWVSPQRDGSVVDEGAQRLALWLEDGGCRLDKVDLVEVGEGQMALVTATDVPAGGTLFEVPDELLLTADAAFADPDVGRELRAMASKRGAGAGFDTFAIAALLAVERVRRGAIRGRLRRQDGGTQIGLINFDRDGNKGEVLPEWKVEGGGYSLQSNLAFSPLVASLPWPDADECRVEPERADAIEEGAKLIDAMIEPAARNAWMKATQRVGAVQSTSDEDVGCRAVEALLCAIECQLEPPPPIGQPYGVARWGGQVCHAPTCT